MSNRRDWLVNIREQHGISQRELASRAGIPRSTVANIEVGRRNPTVSNAQRIAAALGFDWALFFAQKSRVRRHKNLA